MVNAIAERGEDTENDFERQQTDIAFDLTIDRKREPEDFVPEEARKNVGESNRKDDLHAYPAPPQPHMPHSSVHDQISRDEFQAPSVSTGEGLTGSHVTGSDRSKSDALMLHSEPKCQNKGQEEEKALRRFEALAEADAYMDTYAPPKRAGQSFKKRTGQAKGAGQAGGKELAEEEECQDTGNANESFGSDRSMAGWAIGGHNSSSPLGPVVSSSSSGPVVSHPMVERGSTSEKNAGGVLIDVVQKDDLQEQVRSGSMEGHEMAGTGNELDAEASGVDREMDVEGVDNFDAYIREQQSVDAQTDRLVPKQRSPLTEVRNVNTIWEIGHGKDAVEVATEGFKGQRQEGSEISSGEMKLVGFEGIKVVQGMGQDEGHFLSQAAKEAMLERERAKKRREDRERIKSAGNTRMNETEERKNEEDRTRLEEQEGSRKAREAEIEAQQAQVYAFARNHSIHMHAPGDVEPDAMR